MDKELNHKCIICGEMYHACDNCNNIRSYTPWRRICDTFNHYQVYMAIRTYQEGLDSIENIQKDLADIGVKKGSYDDWEPGAKAILDEIFSKSVKKQTSKEEDK